MGFETAASAPQAANSQSANAPAAGASRAAPGGYAAQSAALRPPPETRRVDEAVSGLGNLSGPTGGNLVRTTFDDANAANPTTALPFDEKGGWDAQKILSNLGQADAIEATDSDGVRCVQAVSLASHILQGPADVVSFLGTSVVAAAYKGATMVNGQAQYQPISPRTEAAMKVLAHVQKKVMERTATYGDFSWAQEALHALATPVEKDNEGTAANQVMNNVNPGGQGAGLYDTNAGKGPLGEGVEYRRLASFAPVVDALKDGEQLIVIQYLKWVGVDGQSGHQLILYKEGSTVKLYDPQETENKVTTVGARGAGLERCFKSDSTRTKWIAVAGKRRAE